MAITDKLRSFIKDPLLGYASQEQHVEQLTAIADRIDAALAERYVELPKDTDGEYIHEHDKVDWRDHSGTWHNIQLLCEYDRDDFELTELIERFAAKLQLRGDAE